MDKKVYSIALDGPAGAGKSSVAQAIAKRLQIMYLDTGAMYRTVGLFFARKNMLADRAGMAAHAGDMEITVEFNEEGQRMLLNGEDVTEAIRQEPASSASSVVSAIPEIRARMVEMQRKLAAGYSVVMDGRDIGTCVLPDATLKVYMTARIETRAARRYDQQRENGLKPVYHEILDGIVERDYNDSHREASPLTRAEDAVYLDTSEMTFNAVVERIIELLNERIG